MARHNQWFSNTGPLHTGSPAECECNKQWVIPFQLCAYSPWKRNSLFHSHSINKIFSSVHHLGVQQKFFKLLCSHYSCCSQLQWHWDEQKRVVVLKRQPPKLHCRRFSLFTKDIPWNLLRYIVNKCWNFMINLDHRYGGGFPRPLADIINTCSVKSGCWIPIRSTGLWIGKGCKVPEQKVSIWLNNPHG